MRRNNPDQLSLPLAVVSDDGSVITAADLISTGLLYVCVSEYGALKPGRTATLKSLEQRIAAHRKVEPTMHCVCVHIVGEYVKQEAALKAALSAEPEHLIAGTEWFALTAYTGSLVLDFMAGLGADTGLMEREFARIISYRAH